jgi:hypothetical protein
VHRAGLLHALKNYFQTTGLRGAPFVVAALAFVLPHADVQCALCLGHESMEITEDYLHADPELKEKALAKTHIDTPSIGLMINSSPFSKAPDYAEYAYIANQGILRAIPSRSVHNLPSPVPGRLPEESTPLR